MYQPRHDLIRTLDHVVLFCAQESVRKMTISGRLCLSVQEFSSLFPPLCVKSHKELRATSVPAKHINCQSPQPWKGKLLTAISLNLICINLFDLQRDWLIPIPICRPTFRWAHSLEFRKRSSKFLRKKVCFQQKMPYYTGWSFFTGFKKLVSACWVWKKLVSPIILYILHIYI